jgi:protein-L-isoaspartate O-methyltransferase
MDEPWESHARRLAGAVVRPESRWYDPIATTPRHLLVPRWWVRGEGGRQIRDGSSDPGAWMRAAYSDQTLVTRIGPLHADHAEPGAVARGRTTSSSTMPSLVVTMYRYASLGDGCRTLVTTGTGYGTALLCQRIGADHVTSVDVDPYLVEAAAERLSSMGLHPHLAVADLTQPLAGQYDRIVATVSVPCIPAGWLTALRPGGRLVTTISNTGLISSPTRPTTAAPLATSHGTEPRSWPPAPATTTRPPRWTASSTPPPPPTARSPCHRSQCSTWRRRGRCGRC